MSDITTNATIAEDETANVAFDPRHLLTVSVVLGLILWWLVPLNFLPVGVWGLGIALVVAAFGLFFWAGATMAKADTAVPVDQPTSAIVDDGPFGLSRNPTYAAIILLQLGVAVWTNSLWFVALAILSIAMLTFGVIMREEAYLAAKFGDDYLEYKERVRRWV